MASSLKLASTTDSIWVERTDLELDGTPYDDPDLEFAFRVQPPTRAKLASLGRKHTKGTGPRAKFDQGGYNADLFRDAVVDWRGIERPDGTPLKCDDEGKSFITEHHFLLACLVGAASLDAHQRRLNQNGAALKNSESGGSGNATH